MPRISQVLPWLDAHGVAIVSALAAIVAAWKLVPAPTRARIELAFPRVAGVVRSIAAVAPDLVGFARVVWYQVLAGKARGIVPPAAVPTPIEPDTARHRRGFATVDVLVAAGCAAMLAFTAAALAGCPTWVRPACGAPGAYSCVANQPHVCSPSGALTPVGDLPCSRSRGVCAMSNAGVAHCAPLDAGAD